LAGLASGLFLATIGMMAGEGIQEGYVLVPKDQVKEDPGYNLILVKRDQLKDLATNIKLMPPDKSAIKNDKNDDKKDVNITGANIVPMDDQPKQIKKPRKRKQLDTSLGSSCKPYFVTRTVGVLRG
jgi:hypothetical protein